MSANILKRARVMFSAGFDAPLDLFTVIWSCGCLLQQYRSGRLIRAWPCRVHTTHHP